MNSWLINTVRMIFCQLSDDLLVLWVDDRG